MNKAVNKPHAGTGAGHELSSVPRATLVTNSAGMEQFMEAARGEPIIAVDTESNSLFAYYPRICLIQISFPGADYVIDPLVVDVDPLDEIFADPACQKIFHAAENDILGLKRDFGFSFTNIFDTMMAARILGWQHAGLAAILENLYGVTLNKKMQRTNWGKRPLDAQQLSYAQLDTVFLLDLKEKQEVELRQRGRFEEAQESFDRLPDLEYQSKDFDPDGFWSVPGARDLSPKELAVLRELYIFRDQQASHEDRPPFKIFDNRAMIRVASTQPNTQSELDKKARLAPSIVRRYGPDILNAVNRGKNAPLPVFKRTRNSNGRPDPKVSTRYNALRKWRTSRAHERGVDPDVVLTNDQLMVIARERPGNLQELAAIGAIGTWKVQEYGTDILALLDRMD
ncbi:MAG: ribonuclease D [Anaerolineae bacterium]|nr:ribonuclease D [Anaerolineae bacterium]